MVCRLSKHRRAVRSLAVSLLSAALWTPNQATTDGLYEINTETLMPHLEENLRYAITRGRRCVRSKAPEAFFTILQHQSLNGCKLGAGNRRGGAMYYRLVCDGGPETTGTAELHVVAHHVDGVLQIQMGGKNMTFSQRVEAMRQGDCDSQL